MLGRLQQTHFAQLMTHPKGKNGSVQQERNEKNLNGEPNDNFAKCQELQLANLLWGSKYVLSPTKRKLSVARTYAVTVVRPRQGYDNNRSRKI